MFRIGYRTAGAFVATIGLFALAVAACGGGDSDSPAVEPTSPQGGTSQQATPVPPTQTPIPQDSAVQAIEETGLAVENIELKAGEFGGSVQLEVSNNSDVACNGAVIMVSILREDGSQAAEVGIRGHKIEPGETKSLKDRYFGTAAKAVVSSATCEASSLGDAGAPGRAHTPVPDK